MFKRSLQFLLGKGFVVDRDEMNRQNRLAIGYFAIAGVPVAIANAAAQAIVQKAYIFEIRHLLLLFYFVLLLLFERFVLPRRNDHATLLVYLLEAPVMVISILLGTVWDPTHQAITFPMFMSIIPIFVLDTPARTVGITLGWNIVFVVVATFTKDPAILGNDYVHAAQFFFVSLAVISIVLRLRLEVVYNLDRANYHLEHDVLTNTRNRLSFQTHAGDYVGKPLTVVMGSVDHLDLINDFYGKEAGDDVLGTFAQQLKDRFTPEHTYRYSGDDLLCIRPLERAEGAVAHEPPLVVLDGCRHQMLETRFDKISVPVQLSFGYVTGTPADATELLGMIQLANIYVHQAQNQGEGRTVGGEFSGEKLHAGIVQSNMGMHANSNEINRLTGLPNMPYFVIHAQEMLRHVVNLSLRPLIGYLNVQRFRSYNDKFGYAQGDELIKMMANELREAMPDRYVSYITGGQFAVMCYMDEVEPMLRHVGDALARHKQGHPLLLRAGFAEYHEGDAVISLLDKARMAHDYMDPRQTDGYRLYDQALDEELRLRQYLVNHLDQAIEEGWLQVYYQPIMLSSTQKLSSFEALSRWIDPNYGFLSPAQFISALENEHLIYRLSLYVVRRALADINRMQAMGLPLVPVSVNLSRDDFFACDMVEEITRLVDEAGLPHHVLSIEITESAFTQNQELLRHQVDRFRARGFAVWMDDFGSEYSTLNLMEDLNFDLVKLDMQFMRHFTDNGRNAVIVSAVIEMCIRLGMQTLVEGVEDAEQCEMLCDMGCDRLQGFLFSRPLPFDDVVALVTEREWV